MKRKVFVYVVPENGERLPFFFTFTPVQMK